MTSVVCLTEAAQTLGEGPMWHFQEDALFWVDIEANRLWRWDENLGERDWPLPAQASGVLPGRNGQLWLATDEGVGAFDTDRGTFELLFPIEAQIPERRSNEARCDPEGTIWFSTLDRNQSGKSGRLYRVSRDGDIELWRTGMGIPNTLAWSPSGHQFYFGDSQQRTLFTAAYDCHISRPGHVSPWIRLEDTWPGAVPDGSAMDSEGFLWTALWDGGRIVRHTPSGLLDREVVLPVQRPTSCAFGGANLDTLFVTTAKTGLDAAQIETQPTAGCLYAFRPGEGIRGIAETGND